MVVVSFMTASSILVAVLSSVNSGKASILVLIAAQLAFFQFFVSTVGVCVGVVEKKFLRGEVRGRQIISLSRYKYN